MNEKEIKINFTEFSSLDEMCAEDRELVNASLKSIDGSYAPYSQFHVGAAVRLADGRIVTGANQENAAFPSGLCAERTAMFAANANNPGIPMTSIAISAAYKGAIVGTPASPCGSCRQVMAEYQKLAGRPISIILYGSEVIYKFDRVDDLLPFIFDNI